MTAAVSISVKPAWSDIEWCQVGERLVYVGRPDGELAFGKDRDGKTAWVIGGVSGVVVDPPKEGYPRHRCPDHHMGVDDCICGDDGWVEEHGGWAVVAWEMSDGAEPFRRAIMRDEEGQEWKRSDGDRS